MCKAKKWSSIFCLLLALILVLSACAKEPEPVEIVTTPDQTDSAADNSQQTTPGDSQQSAGVQVPTVSVALKDMAGHDVALSGVPERIVSLCAAGTEILFALGEGDHLVGVGAQSDYPEQVKDIAQVGGADAPDVDAIVALKPDVVLADNDLQSEIIAQLEEQGIPVVCSEAASYEDIYTSIALIAQLTGAEAVDLVFNMREQVQAVTDAVALSDSSDMTVYYVLAFGGDGNRTTGPGSLVNSLIQMAGGVPATKDADSPWPRYTTDEVVALDPDVLLVADSVNIDDLCAAEGYCELAAVQEGRVYQMDSGLIERAGPRVGEALQQVYDVLVQARIS